MPSRKKQHEQGAQHMQNTLRDSYIESSSRPACSTCRTDPTVDNMSIDPFLRNLMDDMDIDLRTDAGASSASVQSALDIEERGAWFSCDEYDEECRVEGVLCCNTESENRDP